jgi:pyruvate dehydrogenase (quinone)
MATTVAEHIVEVMINAGVERVYGVVGDALNPLTDAIRRSERLRWVAVRHEEAGAFAAGADALLTGRPAACAGTCGPGNLHLINGLYDADRNGAAVFAIAGQIPTVHMGTHYFQETHPERVFAECTRYCEVISTAHQIPRLAQLAMQAAIVDHGVGMIVVPGDVLAATGVDTSFEHSVVIDPPRVRPCDADLDAVARLLNEAERPVILGGEGTRGARDDVLQLAERLNAPVGWSFRAKDVLEADNPFGVGMTGLLGWGGLQYALDHCDLLLMLGTDFPYTEFLPQHARVVQVDRNARNLGLRSRLALGVCGDVGETLRALLPRLTTRSDHGFLDQTPQRHHKAVRHERSYVDHGGRTGALRPEQVAAALSDLAAPDAIFTADVGMSCVWAARYLQMTGQRRILTAFGHGTMANALPHALGAQLACPDRQVVAMCGDGGLTMLLGDLLTAVAQQLPITFVVFDNHALGMVRAEMLVAGYPDFGTQLPNPDLGQVATAMGLHGARVDHSDQLRPALERALAHDGPALVDVTTEPGALSIPPKITHEQVRGFALAMTKLIFDRRTDEAVDLARSNLRDL